MSSLYLTFEDAREGFAKAARANHVQTTKHWRQGRKFIQNQLTTVS